MSGFYIGTAGWSYADWEGIVYPAHREPGFHPLPFLAAYINMIEINSTFYRPPAVSLSLSWVKRLAGFPDFLLAVKAHQVFTHDRESWSQKDVDAFRLGIEPLRTQQRLATILFQFPWSFYRSDAHVDYLERLFRAFSGDRVTVEVRHSSWDHPVFYEMLTAHRVCFCNIDQPLIGPSIAPSARTTIRDFSYVRLHGRNDKDWFRKEAGRDDRYNYLYSDKELDDWVERIKDLGRNTDKVFVITNNHYRGQALANALQIKNKISGQLLNIPKTMLEKYPVLMEIAGKLAKGQLDLFEEKT
ncbi:MAG: DUF72 domain-containing protein [Candidatus Aminicenantes bacterium]|nr:DUF72 domain-containing protein [Candidatus Aminicenantes bacterium]